jgi:NAD(P)-dependent dehydrogenase (short-subunit alcohol dehydrogenase family)
MESLTGKVAFITGGASGIGFGMARAFLAEGMKVALADWNEEHIAKARAQLSGNNAAIFIKTNVASRDSLRAAAQEALDAFGKIHVLCNNAGVNGGGTAASEDFDDWDRALSVNLGGVINGHVEFVPQMIAHGRGGHIVSTASLAAEVVMPEHLAIYAASKAAVCHYCEAVKGVLGTKGIGVSILLPGPVKSRIHEASQNRPEHLRAESGYSASEKRLSRRIVGDDWMDPVEVGNLVADGILSDATYLVTHGVFRPAMQARFDAVMAATPDRAEPLPDFGKYRDE